ncbi:MAG: PEP-CTERM sorting domain-containing protein [Phycisphaeraceae bacterium]|nr:PEP-CTERM sorting domain-containing protein [Phycisphaeraceae bacterium]MCW5754487.1 PEP-CTERM sorting domain-containing protein [Phycisphaeraceae bacterium]
MKKIALLAVAGLAAGVSAQSITYNLSAVNMTDAGRGTTNAEAGDVFYVAMSAAHDLYSLGLAKFDLVFTGNPNLASANFDESATGIFNMGPADTGRHPYMRVAVSDRPSNSAVGAAVITAFAEGAGFRVSDAGDGGIDLATFPPTINPLITIDQISSGETFFAFMYTYGGGTETIDVLVRGAGRLYRNAGDGNGATVSQPMAGEGIVITPAPASVALLGLGGLVAARRRRA